jgi:DNA topoisomerase I
MQEDESRQLIQDYYERMDEEGETGLGGLREKGDVSGHEFHGNQWTSVGVSHSVTRDEDGTVRRGGVADKELTARAKALRVPPAWTGLRMSVDPENPLQATGQDSKGRMQYLYSAKHSEEQAAEKFARVKQFVRELPKIDRAIAADAGSREEAACLMLIRKTGIRIGSEHDTGAEKQAYGASTLTAKQVKVQGDTVKLKFVGKKGVDISLKVKDQQLATILAARVAKGGKLFDTDDAKVRDYLHSIDGPFKVKDFRTAKAAEVALQAVRSMPEPRNAKEFAKARNAVGDAVAAKLGNTRSVALSSYVPPEVFSAWKSRLGVKSAVGTNSNLLVDWVESIHYGGLESGAWDDSPMLGDGWWDTPETQHDPDDEE